ncbi:hypothetical protein CO229_02010 [Mycoplasmopsis bovirhinis]|uniref:aquaporin n=1 Tax=Mycoplasmopsis bovirhinis TaxID=29553 RepID=UPI000C05CDA8|nr:aquaporin [Mycoplasmopsis bovirhinis]ATO30879.1 hypothetical protein CO229_02010 [Mycoplasmopsis bovirhinis]
MERLKMDNSAQLTKTQSLFSYFKLKKHQRLNAEMPKDTQTWIIHGISEIVGTALLSLLLAGLSTFVKRHGEPIIIEEYLIHPVLVGFFAGFIAVGLVLFLFLRFSCDLNPAVSITRYLNGTNHGKYTLFKLGMQIIGAFLAGVIIYGVGKSQVGNSYIANAPINSMVAAKKSFSPFVQEGVNSALLSGSLWIFFFEMVVTAILLVPIFSPRIDNKYRDTFIMAIISFSVWMGILTGSAAINPARGLVQQLPTLLFEAPGKDSFAAYANSLGVSQVSAWTGVVAGTFSMLLGTLLGPILYLFIQGFTETFFNPFVIKMTTFKNFKAQNMIKPNMIKKEQVKQENKE